MILKEGIDMEDRIFDMPLQIDKNSREFDLSLLEEIKKLSDIPVNKFDSLMKKIMRKKSSCKLWWDNKEVFEWDGKENRKVNYRCCPSSHKARHYFCLVLDRKETGITVLDGFLSAL